MHELSGVGYVNLLNCKINTATKHLPINCTNYHGSVAMLYISILPLIKDSQNIFVIYN